MTRHLTPKAALLTAGFILLTVSANPAFAREPAQVNYQVLLLRQELSVQKTVPIPTALTG
ncbi:hypothetical protein [Acidithiobacillus thiooxidans]|uniref:hypothetical protein n=1 Tax=Acidithiobacillus thiooxidans TaxID=930 RepID=UPI0004E25D6A|nr:hypothetical protein [Acidithiobacillus thiooxidans]